MKYNEFFCWEKFEDGDKIGEITFVALRRRNGKVCRGKEHFREGNELVDELKQYEEAITNWNTKKQNFVYFDAIFIEKWARRKGLGTEMLKELEDELFGKSIQNFMLKVFPYEEFGFKNLYEKKESKEILKKWYMKNGYKQLMGDLFVKEIQ